MSAGESGRDWFTSAVGVVLLLRRLRAGGPPPPAPVAAPAHLPAVLLQKFGSLFPDHFAMVMATGIVSVDAATLGYRRVALGLLAVNIGAWLLFWLAGAARIAREPAEVARSLGRHQTGSAFLTLVAGTAVLGSQFPSVHLAIWVIEPLFGLALALWWIVIYGFLAGVSEGQAKPQLEHGLSGEWLLVVVATESLAGLGANILAEAAAPQPGLTFACYALVMSGAAFYLFFGSVLLYRFAFVAMPPQDVSGPWWISAGAASITVLAACKLMALPGLAIGAFSLRALLAPVVVLYWADAAFWIPLLALLFAWRFVIRGRRPGYAVGVWAVVFPLGMFGAGTLKLSSVYALDFLRPLGAAFFWIAFASWALAFVAGLAKAGREVRGAG